MRRKPLPALAALLAIFAGACYSPVFDPAISAGALLEARLGAPGVKLGPFSTNYGAELGWTFLPDRSSGARQGVLLARSSQGSNPLWLLVDGTGASYLGQGFTELWEPAGNSRPFAASGISGTLPSLLYSQGSSLNQAQAVAGSPPAINQLLSPVAGWTLAGAGVAQLPASADLAAALLFRDGAGNWGYLWEKHSLLPAGSAQTPAACPDPGLPPGGNFFALSASGPFYYGEPEGGRTAVWDGSAASWTILNLGAPLVALLSNGCLVAQDDYELSLWSGQGTAIFARPAGNIRFAEEFEGGSGETVVLSRCLAFPGSNSPQVSVESWELSLADFLRL